MSCFPARFLALAFVLVCSAPALAQQGQGLQPRMVRPDPNAPINLDADRIEGTSGRETTAEGNARLSRGDLSIRADALRYSEENEEVEAKGNVRLQRAGDTLSGPSLRYSLKDSTGSVEQPEFTLARPLR